LFGVRQIARHLRLHLAKEPGNAASARAMTDNPIESDLTLSKTSGLFRSTTTGNFGSSFAYILTFAFPASDLTGGSDFDFGNGPSTDSLEAALAAAHPFEPAIFEP
jgi:hypothetical protein